MFADWIHTLSFCSEFPGLRTEFLSENHGKTLKTNDREKNHRMEIFTNKRQESIEREAKL
jgi:hypothetical protein